jgi:hypothetical protein
MGHVPLHKHSTLSDEAKILVSDFIEAVEAKDQFGLWVFGDRRSGSSHIASNAVLRLLSRVDRYANATWEHVDTFTLTQEIRTQWDLAPLLRANPSDWGLWDQRNKTELFLDTLWTDCEILWLDDFHHEQVDVDFWRKHVQPWVEIRVKGGKPTIIATTLDPCDPLLDGLQTVIEDLFVVGYATR